MFKNVIAFFLVSIIGTVNYAQTVTIPDLNFKSYLVGNPYINLNLDAEIQLSEALAFTGRIDCSGNSINSMIGIEEFIHLDELICNSNSISSINLSKNTDLTKLSCYYNNITNLDLSANTNLEYLACSFNKLTSLDISNNVKLTELYCQQNMITKLDVTTNTELKYFHCNDNLLTELNFKNGNNTKIIATTAFKSFNNPSLTCIQVDDSIYSATHWSNIDASAHFSTDCRLSIPELTNKETTQIYPNPSNGTFTVSFDKTHPQSIISIYDLLGKNVYNQKLNNQQKVTLNLNLTSGFYFVKINTFEDVQQVFKIKVE